MQKTKMVFTIGPASENKDVLKELVLSGMNVAAYGWPDSLA